MFDSDDSALDNEDSPYDISIVCPCATCMDQVDIGRLSTAVRAALRAPGSTAAPASARIEVAVVDADTIARMNRQYLDHAGPTDVLSFNLTEAEASRLEGVVVVCAEVASREARRRGHDAMAELMLYAVHGTLHLLGYDDADASSAARMHALEDAVLSNLGVGPVYGAAKR